METRDEATSPAADMRLGPIGQFAVKTVIIAAAIVVSAWIIERGGRDIGDSLL